MAKSPSSKLPVKHSVSYFRFSDKNDSTYGHSPIVLSRNIVMASIGASSCHYFRFWTNCNLSFVVSNFASYRSFDKSISFINEGD